MRKIVLFIILLLSVGVESQNIPLPQRCYPLNGNDARDIITGKLAETQGEITPFKDRFGIEGNAAHISENSFIEIPLLADSLLKKGVTVTFWYYVDNGRMDAQCFAGKDKNDNTLVGMRSDQGRAVLNSYHYTHSCTLSTDRKWMWDSCNFDTGGWYQVIIVYDTDRTIFYLANPENEISECLLLFHPDWDLVKSFNIGGGNSPLYIDDFKIYSTVLAKNEVRLLNESELSLSLGPVKLINRNELTGLNAECFLSNDEHASWYLHCAGKHSLDGNNYYIQNGERFTYLRCLDQQGLLLEQLITSPSSFWNMLPVKDDANGKLYQVVNDGSGLCLTSHSDAVILKNNENFPSQQWYLSSDNSIVPTNVRRISLPNENVEIRWNEQEHLIGVSINTSREEYFTLSVVSETGMLLETFDLGYSNRIESNVPIVLSSGNYIVCLSSFSVDVKRKITVSKNH